MASRVCLTVVQNDDPTVSISIFQADGVTPMDITGLTPTVVVKASANVPDTDPSAITLTTSSGVTVVSEANGTLTAQFTHEMLARPGMLWWRTDLTDDDENRLTAVAGPLYVTAA